MKYSLILTAVALAAVLVEAAPHKGKGKGAKGKAKKHHKGKGKGAAAAGGVAGVAAGAAGAAAGGAAAGNAVGAAFFINNEPTGNMVIVNKVASDGTLVRPAASTYLRCSTDTKPIDVCWWSRDRREWCSWRDQPCWS